MVIAQPFGKYASAPLLDIEDRSPGGLSGVQAASAPGFDRSVSPSSPQWTSRSKKALVRKKSDCQYETGFPPVIFMPGWRLWFSIALLAIFMAITLVYLPSESQDNGPISQLMFLKYISIPIVSTLFTYVHIWAALWMTFYPLKYVGTLQIPETNCGCIGWQGIVPSKVRHMARTSVKLMTTRLLTVEQVFEALDPQLVADALDGSLKETLPKILDEVAEIEEPELWKRLPTAVKTELIHKAREDSSQVIAQLMHEIKTDIASVFDLTHMVENAFVSEPELLNHMFIKCGYNELVFIRNCGAYFGAGVGVFQMMLWYFCSQGWMLPAFGLVVGLLSNWIALKVIFCPVEPIPLFNGRIVIQGLFLKRQEAVSVEYSKIVAEHILAAQYLIPAIITGPKSEKLFDIVREHVHKAVDQYIGPLKPIVHAIKGREKHEQSKAAFGERLLAHLPETVMHVEGYMNVAMDLENILREKMCKLPASDFEQLLHPVFQEDEWKLILMGGVLGVIVGCAQWHFLGG